MLFRAYQRSLSLSLSLFTLFTLGALISSFAGTAVFCFSRPSRPSSSLIFPLVSFRSRRVCTPGASLFSRIFPICLKSFSFFPAIGFATGPPLVPANRLSSPVAHGLLVASLKILVRFNFLGDSFARRVYPLYSNRVLSASALHLRSRAFRDFRFSIYAPANGFFAPNVRLFCLQYPSIVHFLIHLS